MKILLCIYGVSYNYMQKQGIRILAFSTAAYIVTKVHKQCGCGRLANCVDRRK